MRLAGGKGGTEQWQGGHHRRLHRSHPMIVLQKEHDQAWTMTGVNFVCEVVFQEFFQFFGTLGSPSVRICDQTHVENVVYIHFSFHIFTLTSFHFCYDTLFTFTFTLNT